MVGVLDKVSGAEEDAVVEAHDEDVVTLTILIEEPIHLLVLWLISCGGHSQQLLYPSPSVNNAIFFMSIVVLNNNPQSRLRPVVLA